MTLILLAYLGGVLTIVSPCILPVLPFVFARAGRPFLSSTLPMLLGMALTFALVASLAAFAGGWAVATNEYGRMVALALLALFGAALLLPALADRLTRPIVQLGARLSQSADGSSRAGAEGLGSLLLGVATGMLWAPCAGPILGLILTGAALNGASIGTSLLLLAYAAGAATSLALALLVGGRVFAGMKRSLHAGEWVRRGLGVAVLAGVVAVASGLDTGLLTRLSSTSTASLEQRLLDRIDPTLAAPPAQSSSAMMADPSTMMRADPSAMMMAKGAPQAQALPVEGTLPSLAGAVSWLNSPPLSADELKGKVVLIDFWTYSCINCLRTIPYVRAWAEKYRDSGLVVIGVHSPEFAFEKNVDNVKKATSDFGITYPVAIDNDFEIWRAFNNMYWPAHYFIDAQGRVRYHHFGEGDYDGSERVIQQLLAEARPMAVPGGLVAVSATGAEAAPSADKALSPETYLGYQRAQGFVSPGGAFIGTAHVYEPGTPGLNEWSLSGDWTMAGEQAALNQPGGAITYRFQARDLHLVLGPAPDGKPVRFRVTIDGAAPGESHGVDVDAKGAGVVTDQRLYQLIRQPGDGEIAEHTFEIRFLDAGAQAYAFTFG